MTTVQGDSDQYGFFLTRKENSGLPEEPEQE